VCVCVCVCVYVCVCMCVVGGWGLKGECGVERFLLESLIVVLQPTRYHHRSEKYSLFNLHIIVVSFV
jgi:hypothetical protein